MFEDRMKTSAIPERVYALCQAIKSRTMQESDLRELLTCDDVIRYTILHKVHRYRSELLGSTAL